MVFLSRRIPTVRSICGQLSLVLFIVLVNCLSANLQAQESEPPLPDLTEIGIEQLMNLDLNVTTVTRKKQTVSSIPGSVYVLTSEEIRRSGAQHIAEALRLVPGVEVARINSNTWAVSIRGFNQRFSDQILILVDGRIVYTPLFSGTFWETIDFPLEIVDRVEVIRGPGASVWGANAVNGVINIITKSSKDSEGVHISSGGGGSTPFYESSVIGGAFSEENTFRLSQKFIKYSSNDTITGENARDSWKIASVNLRTDSDLGGGDTFSLLADGYYESEFNIVTVPSLEPPFIDSDTYTGDGRNYGSSLSLRYNDEVKKDESLHLNLDYIFEERNGDILPLTRHSLHLEGLYDGMLTDDLGYVTGVGYRLDSDKINGNFAEEVIPDSRDTNLFNGFLQLQQSLLDDEVRLLLGTKVEHNDYSGFEVMPTARALWTPFHAFSIWAGYSHAASTPGRVFQDTKLPLAVVPSPVPELPAVVTAFGGHDIDSKLLDAYEIGMRRQFSSTVFIDVSTFYFDYRDIIGVEEGIPFVGSLREVESPALIIPLEFGNGYDGYAYGGEVSVDWAATHWFQLTTFLTTLHTEVTGGVGTLDSEKSLKSGNSPEIAAGFQPRFSLPWDIEIDPTLRYVDRIDYGEIPSYWELNLRVGYHASENISFAVMGENLLDSGHLEHLGTIFSPPATEIGRSVRGEVLVKF
ncbi:MAG: TonB-dependent receptor [Bdellovibrionales bacterium]|nr:TonB-dependent receptor [Bdellovibrionales bacterium]